jgi:MSHA biogenesis protein MshQ
VCNAARKTWLGALLSALALLLETTAFAAAPAGSWWNAAYTSRLQVNIPAGASVLPTAYSVSVAFNHAAEVSAGRSLANGADVRVVRWNGAGWTELDRLADPQASWNSGATRLWFRTVQAVNAGATDNDYYIYYGNPAAAAPPQAAENIFLLFDDFSTGVSASRWTTSGGVNANNGVVRVNPNASLTSDASFGVDTIWETRAQLSDDEGDFEYWGASATVWFVFNVYLRFEADDDGHQAVSNPLFQPYVRPFSPVNPRAFQLYSFTREAADSARFLINGAQVAAFTGAEAPAVNLRVSVRNAEGGEHLYYDWARVRPYRNPEPTLLLGAPEQPSPTPIVHWRMEEPSWAGATGEVRDRGANGLHLTASGANTAVTSPARAGDPGTCRYGVFDGVDDYLQVADHPALEPTSRLSAAAWIYPRAAPATATGLKAVLSKDANYEFHLNGNRQINWWWGGNGRELTTSGVQVPLNQWTHVAITYESGAQRIYINGVQRAASALTGALSTNNQPLQIGQDQDIAERFWNGYIDEVALFNRALSAAEVSALMNATYPCAAAAPKFVVNHDGYGVHCIAETITVDVRDAANNPHTSYAQNVTLRTNTNHGTWSLVSGGGTLNDGAAGDGAASYQWVAGQSSATFALYYPGGVGVSPAVDVDVHQTGDSSVRDDESEDDLVFAPSGFTVTSAALTNPAAIAPFASPQTAGADFSVHVAAYGQTPGDPVCGVIESYSGAKPIKWWSEYANPATGTRQVAIDGAAIATDATNAVAQSLTFTDGRASVTAKYKDVGAISINLRDENADSGVIGGSTGNIVVKPATFVLTNVARTSDGVANPGATSPNGTIFLPAGAAFSATVTARDAEGDATRNFGRETPAEGVILRPAVVAPTPGVDGVVNATAGFGPFSEGAASGADFSWTEVGAVSLSPRVRDGSYLGAGDVVGAASVLGRFVPARFDVSANAPLFQTACPAGGFTYMGQTFNYAVAPMLTVTALSATGSLTQNYRGGYFKLTQASLADRAYAVGGGAPPLLGIPPAPSDLTIIPGEGVATLAFNAGAGLSFARSALAAPFDAQISLWIDVIDADNVKYPGAGPDAARYTIGASGGVPFTSGSQQRYGRLALRNAVGSELINLPTPLRVEYFVSAATGFVQNMADSCTTVASLSFPTTGGNLAANETCALGSSAPGAGGVSCPSPPPQVFRNPGVSGDFNLILRAPGAGNDGSITIEADAPSWLEYDWNPANAGFENPTGVATFGVFQGNSRRIYQRERVR